jgi:hypothetical protein
MIIMITVDATLDISGMASGECILPEVKANGSTVREPFLNSAAYKLSEAFVSTLLTRATLLPTAARPLSHLLRLIIMRTTHRDSEAGS